MISTYGFAPTHIPSFSWYLDRKNNRTDFDKFVATAREVQKRRNINFSSIAKNSGKQIH